MKGLRTSQIVLSLLCLMYLITYLDRVNVSTAAAGFAKDFKLNRTEIGLVFSAFAYPYLVFQIIGGWVSDRFGARRTLIACGLMWASATVLTGLAGGLASLLLARVLLGLGEGATFPAATTAMSRWVAMGQRGYAQGVTHAAARIGNAVAPAVIVIIMAAWGWRASFFLCAALSFAWVALWALTFTEHPKNHPRITQAELAMLPATATRSPHVPWKALFKRMAPVTMVYFCVFFAGVLGDTLGGIATDQLFKRSGSLKHARSSMVSMCMLMTLLSLIPLMFTHDLGISLCCLSAGFFFAEMTIGPMWAIPMDIAPDYSGTASGMMNTGSALAAIISPVVGGYLIDKTGDWQLPFLGSMLLMVAGVLLAFRMRPDSRFEAVS